MHIECIFPFFAIHKHVPVFQEESKFTVFNGADAWTAEDEEAYLDSVEQYGFGNW